MVTGDHTLKMSISDRSRGRQRGKCLTSWGRDIGMTQAQMIWCSNCSEISALAWWWWNCGTLEHRWPSHIIAGVRKGLEHGGMFYKHVEGGYSADYLSASLLLPWHGWLRHCTPIMGSNEWINFFCGVFWGEAAVPQRCSITTDTDTTTIEERQNLLWLWIWEALVSRGEKVRLLADLWKQISPAGHLQSVLFIRGAEAPLLCSMEIIQAASCEVVKLWGTSDVQCVQQKIQYNKFYIYMCDRSKPIICILFSCACVW